MENRSLDLALEDCYFNKERRTLHYSTRGAFPTEIHIHSHHTGRIIRFVPDEFAGINNEWRDGEMMEYTPTVFVDAVEKLVVIPKDY